jgi:hypothetical protein
MGPTSYSLSVAAWYLGTSLFWPLNTVLFIFTYSDFQYVYLLKPHAIILLSYFIFFSSTQFPFHSTQNAGLSFSLFKSILLLLLPVMFFYSFYDRFVFNSSLILVVPPSSSHTTSISVSLIPVFQF